MKLYSKKLLVLFMIFALIATVVGCGEVDMVTMTPTNSGSSSLLSSQSSEYEWLTTSDFGNDLSEAESDWIADDQASVSSPSYGGVSSGNTASISTSNPATTTTSSGKLPLNSSSLKPGSSTAPSSSSSQTPQKPSQSAGFTMRGVWISCFEMPFDNKNETTAKAAMDQMMSKIASEGFNTVFCHVRPAADAFYPSKYFPFSKYINWQQGKDPGYDPLKVMLNSARKYGLQFHAWINPYRVSTSSSTSDLASNNIALTWLKDSSERAVVSGNGIYFNPGSADVQQLILNGIREIVEKYDVDGIHFDDYFYPTTDASFDDVTYAKYKASTSNPLSLANWRRANVNSLVSSAYKICKQAGVMFGISPAGDISTDKTDRNYTTLYADVALWLSTEGYADYIIPQLYYGYNHPYQKSRYSRLLSIWKNLPKHSKMKLYIGLGAYKMDEECDDKAEWHKDSTLMARMATDAKNSGCQGIVVFSYSAAFSNKSFNKQQIKNMIDAIS